MSGNFENYQPTAADLEDTAKLPVLQSAAPAADDEQTARVQLEGGLRALTENLRALEENLRVKSHELSVFEREVGARDRQIAELQSLLADSRHLHEQVRADNAGLQATLAQLHAGLAAAQVDRDHHAAARLEVESARDRHMAELQSLLADSRQLHERARADNAGLQATLTQLHAGLAAAQADRDHHAAARLEVESARNRQIAELQSLLADSRQLHERARADNAGLQATLTQLHAGLAAAQADRDHYAAARVEVESAGDRQVAELQSLLADSRQLHEQVGADNAGLQATLAQLHAGLAAAQADRDHHAAARHELESAHAARELALVRAGEQARQLQQRAENYLEALQTVEVQRQVFEGMVAERELQLQDVEAGAAARAAGVEARLSEALTREQALQSDLQFSRGQSAELDRQLRESLTRNTALAQEMEGLRAGLRQQTEQAAGQQREAAANVARLERELRDHMDMIQAMQQQHAASVLNQETVTADLIAAEQRIRDLHAELQQREVRIDRLNGVEAELRQQLAQGSEALAARDALIARLDSEAASSAAVLGNIQHNLERLRSEPAPSSSAASVAAAADTVVRMLVPVGGDQRVVHLLGRKTSIGRTPDNDLRINQDFISRHHAVILTSSTSAIIEDLNSTNGVIVNGRRVTRQVLNEGDLVAIGKAEFRFVLKSATD